MKSNPLISYAWLFFRLLFQLHSTKRLGGWNHLNVSSFVIIICSILMTSLSFTVKEITNISSPNSKNPQPLHPSVRNNRHFNMGIPSFLVIRDDIFMFSIRTQ